MLTETTGQETHHVDAAPAPAVDASRLHERYFQIRGEVYERMSNRRSPSRVWSKLPYAFIIPFIGVITGSLSFFFYALLGILGAAVIFGVSRFFMGSELE